MLFPFDNDRTPIAYALPDAEIKYYPAFLDPEKASGFFHTLLEKTPWQQDKITVFGKKHWQPRLTALYGNEGRPYTYSDIIMHPHPWTPLLYFLKEEIESVCNATFTTVLLNRYRNGADSNGWHADNEKELGRNPVIASLSLGAERVFHMKHNSITNARLKLNLLHGSLLLMEGSTQHFWKHQIPKTTKVVGERINLTFRVLR